VLDGLDELAVNSPDENPLPRVLPETLPAGVVILCATRPKHPHLHWLEQRSNVHRIDLNDGRWSASNDAACRAICEDQSAQFLPSLDRTVVDEVVRRADGNLLYATRLRDWLMSQPVERRLAMNIPQGLHGFLEHLWDEVRKLDGARRELVMNGLGLACAAREALPAYLFGEILGWPSIHDADEFLHAARPFLIEEVAPWHVRKRAYRLYHESFRELVIEKLGERTIREHHKRISAWLAAWPLDERDTPERTYALRHAVMHRLEAGDVSGAQRLCVDVNYLERKCRFLDTAAIERDLEATARALVGDASVELSAILAAVSVEARSLRDDFASLPTRLYNRLICVGWSAGQIEKALRFHAGRPPLRLLYRVRLGSTQIRSFREHEKGVVACAITPEGLRVLSASIDHTLRLWTLGSGECIKVLRGHDDEVTGCVVTEGGRTAVSSSNDTTAKRWNLESGRCVDTLPNNGRWATACAATQDGRSIVIGSDDGSLRVWDGRSRKLERTLLGHTDYITACIIISGGACIISASRDGSVRAWDRASGVCRYTLQGGEDVATPVARGIEQQRWITALALTPDEKRAFAASGDGFILHWSVTSGRRIERFRVAQSRIDACAITPDGRHLICGIEDGTLVVWSLTAMKRAARLSAHIGPVSACSLTPDGRRVVSASHDRLLKLWELNVPESLPEEAHDEPITACAVTLEASIAVSASEDRTLKLWNLTTGAPRITLEGHEDLVTACAISPDGRYVASGARDGNIRVWDAASGACIQSLRGHGARVSGCAITRDGRLVTVSHDRTVRTFRLATLDKVMVLGSHEDAVEGCAITPDGAYVVSLSRDGAVTLWNLAMNKRERFLTSLGSGLLCGALALDARRAVLGRDDGMIEVYDLRTGQRLRALREHEGRVFGCAVSPDGTRFVSASEDGTVRVWSLATYACIGRLHGARLFRCVAVTRSRICAGDEEGNLWVIASSAASASVAKPGVRAPRKSTPAASSDPGAQMAGAKPEGDESIAKIATAMMSFSAPSALGTPSPMARFLPLREILADLYTDPDEAVIVALNAGLDPKRIKITGKPIVFWWAILTEANHQARVLEVWRSAREDFPKNSELARIGRDLGFQ
jgi:WD40 repeat protein